MKPAPFPHHYRVRLADRQLLAPPRAPIAAGPPPQFGGRDDVWSPEELLLASVVECLWTTFDAYARRDLLEVADWSADAEGILDRSPTGPIFTSIVLRVTVTVAAADDARVRRTLETAERQCIISRALRVPVTVEATVLHRPALERSA